MVGGEGMKSDPSSTSSIDDATRAELLSLVALGRKYKWATGDVRRFLEEHGINLARSDFYSEVPLLSEIESSFEYWGAAGLDDTFPIFDHEDIFPKKRLKFFAQGLVPLSSSFDPSEFERAGSFSWSRGQLIGNDAMSYYATIRRYRPRKVIEIGSGQSTFVAYSALRDNGEGQLYCIDPEPRTDITGLKGIKFARCRVQDVSPAEIVEMLQPGDMIFYDGEHSLKTGNSAVYFYQLVLPYLRSGVIVHVHDVRLPYPRNKQALLDARLYWTEPYIVMAYLHDLSRYQVLFGSEFARRRFPEIAKAMMHGKAASGGGSLWFEILETTRTSRLARYPLASTVALRHSSDLRHGE